MECRLGVVLFVVTTCFQISAQTRIVGGMEATVGEFPSIVSLQKSSHFCGGSLVAPNWVLTAAHCVGAESNPGLKVRIGLHQQGSLQGVETFTVKRAVIHPENDPFTNDYDLTLLELSGSSKFQPVALNEVSYTLSEDETMSLRAITAGWGATKEGGGVSSRLMKVEVPLASPARCEAAYPGQITKSMICAGYAKGGKDSCQGDSGGPLYLRLLNGQPVLIGVVSWGEGCAKPERFGVYADVFSAISWIQSHIGN